MRAAIFDLDGTLADTSGDLIAAANACFDRDWLDPTADQATSFLGGRAMLRLALERKNGGFEETEIDQMYRTLLGHYAENLARETRLFPGVEAALDALAEQRWTLGVCTLKPEGLAEELLKRLGVRDRFASMLGADSHAFKKPDARHLLETIIRAGGAPEQAVLMGDSQTDRDTAENAGVPCVLVRFRPAGLNVEAMKPAALLDHYDDLPVLLNRLVAA